MKKTIGLYIQRKQFSIEKKKILKWF